MAAFLSKGFLDEIERLGVRVIEDDDGALAFQTSTGVLLKRSWICQNRDDLKIFHGIDAQVELEAALLDSIREAVDANAR